MAGSGMEVDPPTTSISMPMSGLGSLKRSSSAPMINALPGSTPVHTSPSTSLSNTACSSPGTTTSPTSAIHVQTAVNCSPIQNSYACHPVKPLETQRIRRFSAGCTAGLHSPTGMSRLDQIKQEESVKQGDREVAHEREVQATMQISHSWEELTLDEPMVTESKRPKSFGEPLHIFTSPYPYSGSPSPTRVRKQCFSPSLQAAVKPTTLTPSPSPSPTRKSFVRRSLSPIALRPSPLSGIKRKAELEDGDRLESYLSPPKRFHPGSSTPERVPSISHPLIHCISSSSIDDSSSPEQQVPNTGTTVANTMSSPNVATPASCFTFRPVRDSVDTHGTDSEASDMTETTDISEHSEAACAIDHAPHGNSFTPSKSHLPQL